MNKGRIAILAGDGIGPEIMEAGIRVLKHAAQKAKLEFTLDILDFGGAAIDKKGLPLPLETLDCCQRANAILLGAIGGPKWVKATKTPEQGLLELRKKLGVYVNIRPIIVPAALASLSPLKAEIVSGTDIIIVRELTGGIYFGEPRVLTDDQAIDTCVYSAKEIKRIIRKAFEIAQSRKKKLTSVDKANVLATSKLWRTIALEIAEEFPEVQLEHQYIDSAAMTLIQNPRAFDVIVTENLFGDILSDEASVLPGSLGMLPSASHSEEGPSLYEPIHGSAPDIAGKNIANPMSMILSITMMLRQSFQLESLANQIEKACDAVISRGIFTQDLGGTATTTDFIEAIIKEI